MRISVFFHRAPVLHPPIGDATLDAHTPARSATHLDGVRLRVVRIVWLALTIFSVVMFAVGLPAYVAALHTVCTGTECPSVQLSPRGARFVEHAGLSLNSYATLVTVDTLLVVLIFCAVGGVIAWRRSDDWLALLVSYMLVAMGTGLVSGSPALPGAPWHFLATLATYLAYAPALFFVFYLFPDGSFTPRWLLWAILAAIGVEAGNNLAPGSPFDVNYWVPNLENLWFFGILAMLAGAQIYRYRHVYSSVQRQQSKWVIFSVAVFAAFGLLVFVMGPLFVQIGNLDTSLPGVLGPLVFVNVFALLFPLSFAIAILRYRLWDIDLIIRRTLIYGAVTGTLAAIYSISALLLQAGFEAVTGQASALAVVGSTLAIAALFQPVRSRVQATVDRRFYRRKYDAAKTLATFGATLHAETDLPQLSEELMAVVQETMQPAQVSLWLRPQSPRASDAPFHQEPFHQEQKQLTPAPAASGGD